MTRELPIGAASGHRWAISSLSRQPYAWLYKANESSRTTIDDRRSVHIVLGRVPHGTRLVLGRALVDAMTPRDC